MTLDRLPEGLPECPAATASRGELERSFGKAGFLDPAAAVREWNELLALCPEDSAFRFHLAESWQTLGRVADPDLALRQWVRWIRRLEEGAGQGPRPASGRGRAMWGESRFYRESLLAMLGLSPALGDELLRDHEAFDPETWSRGRETAASLRSRLGRAIPPEADAEVGEKEFIRRLNRFQRTEEVRIAFLDECLRLPVADLTRQISWLADVLVDRCLRRALADTGRRFNVEPTTTGLVVLGLGKLGGLELNYSSDIDLNFVMADRTGIEGLSNPESFFTRTAEKVIRFLSEYVDGPPLYRVDTRLRPEGSRGKLVWRLRPALDYYHSKGRTWERQALIRLRAVAGDIELARRFQRELRPFVFRALLTEEAIQDIQRLKLQIESLAASSGESDVHVKVGEGGIRDVEFIVQYLQLLFGARHPELQDPNTFDALESLQAHGILNADETDRLHKGYQFLRQVEHRIQVNHRLQSHVLPRDPADLRRIVRGLGFESEAAFRARLGSARAGIRVVYRRLFESAATREARDARISSFLELPLESVESQGEAFLARYGFEDPGEALRKLRLVGGESAPSWDQGHATDSFRRIAAHLLREISQYPDPDRTLANFHDCVQSLGARSIFFDLLHESTQALSMTVELCGHSSYVVEILRNFPGLFDEVIDAMRTGYRAEPEELSQQVVRVAGESNEEESPDLRPFFEFKFFHILLTAFRDVEREENLRMTMVQISRIASALIEGLLILAGKEATAKLGEPVGEAGRPSPAFLVLGLGKLGGEEMNYRSDLDIVFLYRGAGKTTRGYTLREYYIHMAKGLYTRLTRAGLLGALWETDARLRPMGSNNPLAVSMDEWQRYFESGQARTWERQAALRARPVAGDPGTAGMALEFIRTTVPLREGEDPAVVRGEVLEMRHRIEESAPREDIKRGPGGIVDVEFIVQYLQLLHGGRDPDLIQPNTVAGLNRLIACGAIDSHAGSELLSAYEFLRWLETRFSLLLKPGESVGNLDREKLRSLIQRIGYRSTSQEAPEEIFLDELQYHRARTRSHLETLLAPPSEGGRPA